MNPRLLAPALASLALAACGSADAVNPADQLGPNPVLPKAKQYLLPPMKIGEVLGWKAGEHPVAPAGFTVQALATKLNNPRQLYTLPNGDITSSARRMAMCRARDHRTVSCSCAMPTATVSSMASRCSSIM